MCRVWHGDGVECDRNSVILNRNLRLGPNGLHSSLLITKLYPVAIYCGFLVAFPASEKIITKITSIGTRWKSHPSETYLALPHFRRNWDSDTHLNPT